MDINDPQFKSLPMSERLALWKQAKARHTSTKAAPSTPSNSVSAKTAINVVKVTKNYTAKPSRLARFGQLKRRSSGAANDTPNKAAACSVAVDAQNINPNLVDTCTKGKSAANVAASAPTTMTTTTRPPRLVPPPIDTTLCTPGASMDNGMEQAAAVGLPTSPIKVGQRGIGSSFSSFMPIQPNPLRLFCDWPPLILVYVCLCLSVCVCVCV